MNGFASQKDDLEKVCLQSVAMKNFLKLLRELQKINPEFPLQYAICLSVIAMHEGLSISELSDKTRLSLSTISRIVAALSKMRDKGNGYDLVRVEIDEQERRRKRIYLTPKGLAVVESITDMFENFEK